jgi:hypothetical protein
MKNRLKNVLKAFYHLYHNESSRMDSAGLSRVFTDSKFWYKLDVDYEDAIQCDSSDIGDDEESQNIAGVLLDEFVKRKRHVIEEEYNDIKNSKRSLRMPVILKSV